MKILKIGDMVKVKTWKKLMEQYTHNEETLCDHYDMLPWTFIPEFVEETNPFMVNKNT